MDAYSFTVRLNFSECQCNAFGSKSLNCEDNGQCSCLAYVNGHKCDTCNSRGKNFPNCASSKIHLYF